MEKPLAWTIAERLFASRRLCYSPPMDTIKINMRLLTKDGTPLPRGTEIHVLDEDPLRDDTLSQMAVGQDGAVEVFFGISDVRSADTPTEALPDIYVLVESGPYAGFRSKTFNDIAAVRTIDLWTANTTHDLKDVVVHRP